MDQIKVTGLNEYQEYAGRTANKALTKEETLCNCALGLSGEAGEVASLMEALGDPRYIEQSRQIMVQAAALAELVKKNVFHKHDVDRPKTVKELGDYFWYFARFCATLGISLEEIATTNVNKLADRYPEGFTSAASINRKD